MIEESPDKASGASEIEIVVSGKPYRAKPMRQKTWGDLASRVRAQTACAARMFCVEEKISGDARVAYVTRALAHPCGMPEIMASLQQPDQLYYLIFSCLRGYESSFEAFCEEVSLGDLMIVFKEHLAFLIGMTDEQLEEAQQQAEAGADADSPLGVA